MTEEKLGPSEGWGALEEMLTADDAVRVSALSDADLDADLAARGLDPSKLRAAGEALAAELSSKEKGEDDDEDEAEARGEEEPQDDEEEVVEELPPKSGAVTRPRWVTWAVAAGVAAVLALPLLGIPVVRRAVFSAPVSAPAPPTDPSVVRAQGLHDCEEKRWLECWRKLDEAKSIDPRGEDSDDVREARAAIRKALEPREP